jgi:hypothetical protein
VGGGEERERGRGGERRGEEIKGERYCTVLAITIIERQRRAAAAAAAAERLLCSIVLHRALGQVSLAQSTVHADYFPESALHCAATRQRQTRSKTIAAHRWLVSGSAGEKAIAVTP